MSELNAVKTFLACSYCCSSKILNFEVIPASSSTKEGIYWRECCGGGNFTTWEIQQITNLSSDWGNLKFGSFPTSSSRNVTMWTLLKISLQLYPTSSFFFFMNFSSKWRGAFLFLSPVSWLTWPWHLWVWTLLSYFLSHFLDFLFQKLEKVVSWSDAAANCTRP